MTSHTHTNTRVAVAVALAAAMLTTGSAAARTPPAAAPMPTPGQSPPSHVGDRVAALDTPPPLTVRSAMLTGRKLRVSVQCEQGLRARVAVTDGQTYDTTSLRCQTGRARLSFTVPASLARTAKHTNVSLPLRVTVKGRVPVTVALAVGRVRRALAHASDYAIDWMTSAYCTSGALWGDPGSVSISIYDDEGYGAPVGSQIFFRTWIQSANGAWAAYPGDFWSYRYFPPGTSGSYTDDQGVWHYVGGSEPGRWLNPQVWIVSPHNWVRPVIEIHVPATGRILYYNVPVRSYPTAGAGPGVGFSQPNWCGFGV